MRYSALCSCVSLLVTSACDPQDVAGPVAGGSAYDFAAHDGVTTSLHIGQRLHLEVGRGGLSITPSHGAAAADTAWRVGLRLSAIGRRAQRTALGETGAPEVTGDRSTLSHDQGVEEWYTNGPLGIEQGFVLNETAAGSELAALALQVDVLGDLAPVASADNQAVTLRGADGDTVLHYTDLSAHDDWGRPLATWMAVEARSIVLYVDDHDAVYPVTVDPLVWGQTKKLVASDATTTDFFGGAVSVSGETAAVGARWNNAVYVYERNLGGADNWGQRKKLIAGGVTNLFGAAVAISGDSIIVGALGENGAGSNRGAAYIYERNLGGADNWGQRKRLVASDGADSDYFANAVAISGDIACVGASEEDGAGANRGAAYVFERNLGGADNWGERKKLTASDAADNDELGMSVGASGDTIIAGAWAGSGTQIGMAYIYDRNLGGADNWSERKKLTASDGVSDDEFGYAVAIDGDTAVVGAHQADGAFANSGAGYVYERNLGGPDNWGQRKKLVASDPGGDYLGSSVSISVDRIILGAPFDNTAFIDDGSAYVFERHQGGTDNWGQTQKLLASDGRGTDNFGKAVAISGDWAIVGADYADAPLSDSGAAYVFGGRLANGSPCAMGTQCISGLCVDDVCCNAACGGGLATDCQACSVATGAAVDGTCGPRTDGSTCTDGLYCTGTETCAAGVCGGSTGDPCATNVGDADSDCSESCDETFDTCTANDPNGSACNDGLFCSGNETCTNGACGGSTGDPCLANVGDADTDCSESCNEAADSCTSNDPDGSACSDGLYCTGTERCTAGACGSATGDPCAANVGDADTDCSESCNEAADNCTANDPNGSACNDGLYCTGTESCSAGVCGSSGDPCAVNVGDADTDCSESCNEAADNCTANDPNGSACSDGLYCTGTETCSGGACDSATGDPCATNVGDADTDCSESCNETTDNCTANDPNGSSCNDGLFCTGSESCLAGVCASTGDPCAANLGDADSDCSESCNEAADNCTANDPNGSACSDGLFCTATDTCSGGACQGAGSPCPGADGDADCAESCNEAADNCAAPDPNGSACNDGLYCTVNEVCNSGACNGQARDCSAGVSCRTGTCDEGLDQCTGSPVPDGQACDDGLFCTATESCAAGDCVGSGDPCPGPDGDADCSETCDETLNSCSAPDPNGSSCNDGSLCSQADECQAGTCAGVVVTCTAIDACHEAGQCEPLTGACSAPAKPDGTACSTDGDAAGTCGAGACVATETPSDATGGCGCVATARDQPAGSIPALLLVLLLYGVTRMRRSLGATSGVRDRGRPLPE